YSSAEYIGQPLARFYADPALAESFLGRLSSGETLRDFAAALVCKGGEVKHVLVNANVYRIDGRFEHTRCFIRDVTDRRRLEETRAARADARPRADRVKDDFLAPLSHELRTPLNAMLGWARLLRRGQLESAKHQEAIATIERNATQQAKLIDDMLDL